MTKFTEFIKRHKTRLEFLAPFVYILVLVLSALYINSTLQSTDLDIKELPEEEKEEGRDRKEIDVKITVLDINNKLVKEILLPNTDNTDTINEVLEEARENELLYYERVNFSYGTEIEKVMDLDLPENYSWRVFLGEEDITNIIVKVALIDREEQREIILKPVLAN